MKHLIFKPLFLMPLVAAILVFSPAHAQWRSMEELLPKDLTPEDIQLMKETARSKMEKEPADTVLKWQNPSSGNSGAVRLLKRFQLPDRECMTNRHYVLYKSGEKQIYEFTVCRKEGGEWIIDS